MSEAASSQTFVAEDRHAWALPFCVLEHCRSCPERARLMLIEQSLIARLAKLQKPRLRAGPLAEGSLCASCRPDGYITFQITAQDAAIAAG